MVPLQSASQVHRPQSRDHTSSSVALLLKAVKLSDQRPFIYIASQSYLSGIFLATPVGPANKAQKSWQRVTCLRYGELLRLNEPLLMVKS